MTFVRVSLAIAGFMWVGPLNGEWIPPVDLSLGSQDASVPQVAVDPSGNATAVWRWFDGSNYVIQASSKPFLGSWQPVPDTISQPYEDAFTPQIIVDAQGNATAIWERSNGTYRVIQASTKSFGGTWQAVPDDLSTPDSNATEPQIAVDPHGNITAVWGRATVVQASSKPFGGSWSLPEIAIVTDFLGVEVPQIVVDKQGNATVVCLTNQSGSDDKPILSSSKPYGGSWQSVPDTIFLIPWRYSIGTLAAAVDGLGDVTVVWVPPLSTTIYASTRPYGGTWQAVPDTISNGEYPCIAADVHGNVTIAWQEPGGGFSVIRSSTRPHGGSWQTTPDVLSSPIHYSYSPQMIADGWGDLTAVWIRGIGTGINTIQSLKRPYGSSWSADPIGVTFSGSVKNLELAVDGRGNVTAVWKKIEGKYVVQSSTDFVDLLPPATFEGYGAKKGNELFLKTHWTKSTTNGIAFYEIFARDHLVEKLSANEKLEYIIRLHPHHPVYHFSHEYKGYLQNKYRIRSVDADGNASAFTQLNMEH